MVHVSQIIMMYTLNLYSAGFNYIPIKLGEKRKKEALAKEIRVCIIADSLQTNEQATEPLGLNFLISNIRELPLLVLRSILILALIILYEEQSGGWAERPAGHWGRRWQ